MSLVDDKIRQNNLEHKESVRNSALEHMAELERQRLESEMYNNPLYKKFWARRKKQTQKLRETPHRF